MSVKRFLALYSPLAREGAIIIQGFQRLFTRLFVIGCEPKVLPTNVGIVIACNERIGGNASFSYALTTNIVASMPGRFRARSMLKKIAYGP